jgi:hypothetical protein
MRRGLLGCGILVVGVGGWVACVGGDPLPRSGADPNVPVGQYRGACTADGKCLEGLECNQGVCLYPDGAAPPDDGGSVDAGEGGPASPVSCPHADAARAGNIPCPTVTMTPCTPPSLCCFANPTSACVAASDPCGGGKKIRCASATCGNGGHCCLRATAIDRTQCPARIAYGDLVDTGCNESDTDCPLEERVCDKDADCPEGTCHTVALFDESGDTIVLGACRP